MHYIIIVITDLNGKALENNHGVFKFKESRSVSAYLELYKIIMNMSKYLKKRYSFFAI